MQLLEVKASDDYADLPAKMILAMHEKQRSSFIDALPKVPAVPAVSVRLASRDQSM